jgi:subtilisin family serine protease
MPADVTVVPWNGHQDFVVAGQWMARFAGINGPVTSQVHEIQALLDTTNSRLQVVRQLGLDGQVLLQGPRDQTPEQIQAALELPGLLYIEPNFFNFDTLADTYPNNPSFNLDYGLHNTGQTIQGQAGTPGVDISAPQAWDISTGSTSVTIADIDTGVDYDHPDLYKNIWINQAEIPASRMQNLVDVDGDGKITFRDLNDPINQGPFKIEPGPDGWVTPEQILAPMVLDAQGQDTGMGGWAYPGNTQDGDTDHPNDFFGWNFSAPGGGNNRPFDGHGHGTHTAGTIAAEGNSGIGVAGVNWVAQLMPVKWLADNAFGNTADAVAAVNYSWRHGAAVSSNAWFVQEDSQALYDAIAGARTAGDLFVCAALNFATDTDTRAYYPETYIRTLDNMISVAALDNRDHIASFSDWGLQTVSLGGPGVDVYSTKPTAFGSYGYDSGTSMATPHVAGAAALALGIAPGANYQEIRQAMFDSVDPVADLRVDGPHPVATGGRLDLFRFLQDLPAAGPVVFSSRPAGNVLPAVSSIRFTFDVPIDVSTFTTDQIDRFTGPDGDIPVLDVQVVPDSGNTQFDVLFAQQTVPGSYRLTIGPNILDEQGNPMDQNHNGVAGEVPGDEYTASFTIQGLQVVSAVPDSTLAGQATSLRFTFNEPVDPTTFDQYAFTDFSGPDGQHAFASVVPVAGSNDTQFDAVYDNPLTQAGSYSVTLGPSVSDLYGNYLSAPYTTTFSLPAFRINFADPSGQAIRSTDHVRLTFDRPEDPSLVDPAAFTLTGPGGAVQITGVNPVSGSGNTQYDVSFDPLETLGSYSLNVSGITDAYNNPLTPFTDNFLLVPGYLAEATTYQDLEIFGQAGTQALRFRSGQVTADNDYGVLDLGSNHFSFYGQRVSQLDVSSNGLITLGSGNPSFSPASLVNFPAQAAIAAYWTDLIETGTEPMIVWQIANNQLIIEWYNVTNFQESTRMTFQAILDLNTAGVPGDIVLNYRSVTGVGAGDVQGGITVGVKDAATVTTVSRTVVQDGSHGGHGNPLIATGHAIRFIAR